MDSESAESGRCFDGAERRWIDREVDPQGERSESKQMDRLIRLGRKTSALRYLIRS